LKFWLLTTEYPPFFGGGIGTYCYITSRMMAGAGHAVTVFVNDASVHDFKIDNRSESLRIVRFNPSRTGSMQFLGHVTNISYEFAAIIKDFVAREGKPDIIESQEYLGIAYYLLQFKWLRYDWCRDIPVLITMHSPSFLYMEYNQVPEHRLPNYWICEMERFSLQAADMLISPSRFMLTELTKRFELSHSRFEIIPNPFTPSRETTGPLVNAREDQIVFYGKLTAQKGAFHLLRYFQELWEKGFERPLYVLGGHDIIYQPIGLSMGDLIKKKYAKYIRSGLLKLEGKIKPVDMARRLSTAEVVVIPSLNDNLPYTVFEMMALGKLVLVSKQGGQSEVVENGVDGFVFDHEQPGSFSNQLKKTLELTADQREGIRHRAIEKIRERYDPEIIVGRKEAAIAKAMANAGTARSFPFVRPVQAPARAPASSAGLLSVVIPYFNMGGYIGAAVASVLRSNYSNKEIIIINDGSTDPYSISQLNTYREKEHITVVDGPNQGLARTRNKGAECARGEFIAFLDADDTVQPDYYAKAVVVLDTYDNVEFVGCWTKYFDQSIRTWPGFLPEPPLMLYHNMVNSSSLVFNREGFLRYGRNDANMPFPGLEDYDTVISLLQAGCRGVMLPEVLFNYRVRKDSMIREISPAKKMLLCQYIAEKHKSFYATFAADIYGLLNTNGPGFLLDNPSLDYHLAEKIPFGGSVSRKIISLVKRNGLTRRVAYKIYRLLNR
jgi:glycosyltransferase involved in cell wall biosynthesis